MKHKRVGIFFLDGLDGTFYCTNHCQVSIIQTLDLDVYSTASIVQLGSDKNIQELSSFHLIVLSGGG